MSESNAYACAYTYARTTLFIIFAVAKLDMLLKSTEVNIELMQWLKESAERRASGHLGEGVDILREALATIAELAIRTRNIGVGVVDVPGEEHAGVYLAPVASHLFAVLAAGVEVGYLVGSEDIVHVLGELSFEG